MILDPVENIVAINLIPLVIYGKGVTSLLNPLSDGIGADIIFLGGLIGRGVILEDLPHYGLLLGLGHWA